MQKILTPSWTLIRNDPPMCFPMQSGGGYIFLILTAVNMDLILTLVNMPI
jgi:hypothetical protein